MGELDSRPYAAPDWCRIDGGLSTRTIGTCGGLAVHVPHAALGQLLQPPAYGNLGLAGQSQPSHKPPSRTSSSPLSDNREIRVSIDSRSMGTSPAELDSSREAPRRASAHESEVTKGSHAQGEPIGTAKSKRSSVTRRGSRESSVAPGGEVGPLPAAQGFGRPRVPTPTPTSSSLHPPRPDRSGTAGREHGSAKVHQRRRAGTEVSPIQINWSRYQHGGPRNVGPRRTLGLG